MFMMAAAGSLSATKRRSAWNVTAAEALVTLVVWFAPYSHDLRCQT